MGVRVGCARRAHDHERRRTGARHEHERLDAERRLPVLAARRVMEGGSLSERLAVSDGRACLLRPAGGPPVRQVAHNAPAHGAY